MLSPDPGVITRADVCTPSSVVVPPVTDGPASVTAMAARAVGPVNPPTAAVVDSWTVNPPGTKVPGFGVNLSPAPPWAKVMKLPWYRVVPLIPVERATGDDGNLKIRCRAIAESRQ